MSLPRWATTITPFSKLVAFILFITLPLLTFYLGLSYQRGGAQAPAPVVSYVPSHNTVISPTNVPTSLPELTPSTSSSIKIESVVTDYALKHGYKKPIITTDFIKNTQARGNIGDEGAAGGAKWFAAVINNQWTVVWIGNGLPPCSEVSNYNLPKDFLTCY